MSLAILLGPEGKTVVFVAYSDETGVDDEDSPFAIVAAVLLNMDSQWPPVIKALEQLQPNRHREIKGRQLFRDLRDGRKRKRADELLSGVLNIAFENRLPVFQSPPVNKAGFKKYVAATAPGTKRTVHDFAFAMCLHSVDVWVHTTFPTDQVVWISDDAGHYEEAIAESLALCRGNVKYGLPLKSLGPQAIHIADTVYFGSSKASRALQLADVCCSTIREHFPESHVRFLLQAIAATTSE